MDIIKPVGTEEACNATPKTFGNTTLVRVFNTATGNRLLTVKDIRKVVTVTVDTSVNATTLFVLTTGDTSRIQPGDQIVNSSNVQVVNTGTAAVVASVVNATAFVANVDILIANGTADVGLAALQANITLAANTIVIVSKNRDSTLHSNNNTEVLAIPIAWKE